MWQSYRAAEKEVRLSKIEQLSMQKEIPLSSVLQLSLNDMNDLPVAMSGQFDNQHIILLDNQTHKGKVGYRVYMIFDDQLSQQSVLVNLGWIQGSKDRNTLPTIEAINGKHSLLGHVRVIDSPILLAKDNYTQSTWPLRVQSIKTTEIEHLTGKSLLPFVIFLNKEETIGYLKNWQPIVMSPEKHRGYAFQWFSLAAAWLFLMIWALWKHHKNKNNVKQEV